MTRRLGNRYELQEQIGGGGMAVVYRAVDTLLNRIVAVKMLRPQFEGDEELIERFRQEAQSVAKLAHPNIVNIYDVGITEGEYYIVMEYVDGPTLKDLIRERGPLSPEETVNITQQICKALEHAHSHHIIHRDVKPHNILLTKSNQVKVTDFGIARAITGNTVTYHNEKSVMGSVHYFSPEQARGGTTDVKSDIYSLGVVMYEVLTGRLPFSGDSAVSVALKHLRDNFIDPRELKPEIPQSLENVVLRCLVKAPEYRYEDMNAVQQDLNEALANPNVPKFQPPASVTQQTIAVPAVQDEQYRRQQEREAEESTSSRKRSVWKTLMWIAVAVVMVVVAVLAAYYILMSLLRVPNINLPNVVGDKEQQAVTKLIDSGLTKSQITEEQGYSTKQKGVVYQQDPSGNQDIKKGRTVTIYISSGAQPVDMPDLAGVPLNQAESLLSGPSYGFPKKNIKVKKVLSSNFQQGQVISTNPSAGSKVTPSQTITFKVSKGAPQTTVPDIVGKPIDKASQLLNQSGLTEGNITQQDSSQPYGTVLSIAPYSAGQKVDKGTSIDLVVSSGPSSGPSSGSSGNNQSGSSNTNLPPGTKQKTVDVTIHDKGNQTHQVQISKTDATGQDQTVVNQTINKQSSFTVQMYIAPNTQGTIQVTEDGKQIKTIPVSY